MTLQEKIEMLEEIMDVDAGSVSVEDQLIDIDEWDSISVLSFMSEMKKRFGKSIEASMIKELKTVQDVCDIIPD